MLANRFASIIAIATTLFIAGTASAADNYKVDPVHSSAIFRIKHANTSNLYGRINNPEGTIAIDESDATKSTFNIQLQSKNVDTGNTNRDTHLRSPDFFSAQEFPTLSFKSTAVKAETNKLVVTGDLSIHGQTKSVPVTLERTGTTNAPQLGRRVGFEGTFTIKRSDFGMKTMLDAVGDDVQITISLEAARQ